MDGIAGEKIGVSNKFEDIWEFIMTGMAYYSTTKMPIAAMETKVAKYQLTGASL